MVWLWFALVFASGFFAGTWWASRSRPDLRVNAELWTALLERTGGAPVLGSRRRMAQSWPPATVRGVRHPYES